MLQLIHPTLKNLHFLTKLFLIQHNGKLRDENQCACHNSGPNELHSFSGQGYGNSCRNTHVAVSSLSAYMPLHRLITVVVATSTDTSDDAIVDLCHQHDIAVFRGELEDVLKRYHQVIQQWPTRHVVRITGDCPLIDPEIIDQVIATHFQEKNDYTSNVAPPTFPDGLDVEIFTVECLNKAFTEATLPSQREHVTLYIHQNPAFFKIGNVASLTDFSHLRWTVDSRGISS